MASSELPTQSFYDICVYKKDCKGEISSQFTNLVLRAENYIGWDFTEVGMALAMLAIQEGIFNDPVVMKDGPSKSILLWQRSKTGGVESMGNLFGSGPFAHTIGIAFFKFLNEQYEVRTKYSSTGTEV